MHLIDNYRLWDDDMIVGSVHPIEYQKILYWLDRVGYDGYLSVDQYLYRWDLEGASSESIAWLRALRAMVDRAGAKWIGEVLRRAMPWRRRGWCVEQWWGVGARSGRAAPEQAREALDHSLAPVYNRG